MFEADRCREALERIRAATESHLVASLDIELVLNRVLGLGFRSCRYYDIALTVPSHERVLILSAHAGDTRPMLGYKIPLKDSTIGQATDVHRAVPGTCVSEAADPRFVKDLSLEGRSWVDIPLSYQRQIIGLLAVDWTTAGATPITSQDLVLLEFIAMRMVNCLMAQQIPASIVQIDSPWDTTVPGRDRLHRLFESTATELCRTLSTGAVAIFQHRWQSNTIVKIAEDVHLTFASRRSDFDESYSPSKASLTWQAWQDLSIRYMADFAAFQRDNPRLVDQACLNRHETLLGSVVSILYSVVGLKDDRYLIRIMNRVDQPELPFATRHAHLLESISEHLSNVVDQTVEVERFRRLEKTARDLCGTKIIRPADALEVVLRALEVEGISSFAVLAHANSGSPKFKFVEQAGPLLRQWDSTQYKKSQRDGDRFYSRSFQLEKPTVLDARSFQEHSNRSSLLGFLCAAGVEWVLVCPFSGSDTRGVMVCPLFTDKMDGQVERVRTAPQLGVQRERILATYAAMLGSAIESIESSLTFEGARRLIGHIGHEVNTPAIMLGQWALYVLDMLRTQAAESGGEALKELATAEQKVRDNMRTIDKTMEVATLVGQATKKRLELELRRYLVRDLLETARSSVLAMRLTTADGVGYPADIELSQSCERMPMIVCDREHLLTVFQNLLINGIKYSLARPSSRGARVVVSVRGLIQTNMVIFQVTNVGLGILPEDRELIFGPFVRGTMRDARNVTRGMGLGLYISRRIAVAHGGELFVQKSERVLDDSARRQQREVHETVFELRLSRSLREGITEYVWDEEF